MVTNSRLERYQIKDDLKETSLLRVGYEQIQAAMNAQTLA